MEFGIWSLGFYKKRAPARDWTLNAAHGRRACTFGCDLTNWGREDWCPRPGEAVLPRDWRFCGILRSNSTVIRLEAEPGTTLHPSFPCSLSCSMSARFLFSQSLTSTNAYCHAIVCFSFQVSRDSTRVALGFREFPA